MIRIAFCTHMNRADHLRLRIVSAVAENVPIIDVFDSQSVTQALQSPLPYDAFWIAIDGAAGMEAVISIRDYAPAIPVVWMSEDKLFAAIACNLRVSSFLTQDCTEEEIAAALQTIKNDRREQYAHCIVLP